MVDIEQAKTEIRKMFLETIADAEAGGNTFDGRVISGERLEQLKEFIDLLTVRGFERMKRLIAGRSAAEITPEESAAILEEAEKLQAEDLDQLGELEKAMAGPFVALRQKTRDRIRKSYEETGSWQTVYTTEVYDDRFCAEAFISLYDDRFCAEAFISLVEEKTGKTVQTGEQLRDACGLTEDTDTLEGFQKTVNESCLKRYDNALDKALANGAKYKDLLAIDPESFGVTGAMIPGTAEARGIPEEDAICQTWKECKQDYIEIMVRYAIVRWASLYESSFMRADLQDIAERLEAPFIEIWKAAESGDVLRLGIKAKKEKK